MRRKLKFFDTEQDVLNYLTSELLDTLRDDLGRMTGDERRHYTNEDRKDLRAKIHDIEAVEDRLTILAKPKQRQSQANRDGASALQ